MTKLCQKFGVILFADAIERIDIQILEIRHLQCNLIYSLKEAGFYNILRHEEDFLWGTCLDRNGKARISWEDLFAEFGPPFFDALSDLWVPALPRREYGELDGDGWRNRRKPDRKISEHLGDFYRQPWLRLRGTLEKLSRRLNEIIYQADSSDLFIANYRLLEALQSLKRNLLLDKLHLAYWGLRAISRGAQEPAVLSDGLDQTGQCLAEFLLVRAAVLRNMRRSVERLGDFNAIFNMTLDLGLHDHHRPIISRRREIGLYNNVMNVRANNLYEDLCDLFDALDAGGGDGARSGDEAAPPGARPKRGERLFDPIVVHRWQHDFTSQNFSLLDISQTQRAEAEETEPERWNLYAAHAINTSYWMPERPDLLNILAHECVHLILRERLGNLDDHAQLAAPRGRSRMLRRLIRELFFLQTGYGVAGVDQATRGGFRTSDVREVLTDLLSATVAGPAYLFALCQELLGVGTDDVLQAFRLPDYSDLSRAAHVFAQPLGDVAVDPVWYPRILAVCAWLEASLPREEARNPLVVDLIEGARQITRLLFSYLSDRLDPGWGLRHKNYTSELCAVVGRSPLVEVARDWRMELWRDGDAFAAKKGSAPRTPRVRRAARVSEAVRLRLLGAFVRRKQGRRRFTERVGDQTSAQKVRTICEEFFRVYFQKEPSVYENKLPFGICRQKLSRDATWRKVLAKAPMFHHAYDIPWQAAWLRAQDVIEDKSDQHLLDIIHFDFQPGRELYQVAMEFVIGANHGPRRHLRHAVKVVAGFVSSHQPENDPIVISLKAWQQLKPLDKKAKGASLDLREQLWDVCNPHREPVATFALQASFDDHSGKLQIVLEDLDCRLRGLGEELPTVLEELRSEIKVALRKLRDRRFFEARLLRLLLPPIGEDRLPDYTLHKIGRTATSRRNSLSKLGKEKIDPFIRVSEQQNSRFGVTKETDSPEDRDKWGSRVKRYRILGRFDYLSFRASPPVLRWPLARSSANGDQPQDIAFSPEETFTPFFARREFALRVALTGPAGKVDLAGDAKAEVAGFVWVRTKRRRSRLELLDRLRAAYASRTARGGVRSHLSRIGPRLRAGDHAYLAEGWGDVLLVIAGKPAERLDDVFAIQGALFDSFLVDRTELFFPTGMLDGLLEGDELRKRYGLVQTVRCAENTGLADSEEALITQLAGETPGLVKVQATPGRHDYALTYNMAMLAERVQEEWAQGREAIDFLDRLLVPAGPDEIITTIGRCIEIRHDVPNTVGKVAST